MKIQLLNRRQVKQIYKTKMVNDFPPMELKPLMMILAAMSKGKYICYGLMDDSEENVLGYAFFVKRGNHYLFDYLAVSEDKRNSGIGTEFLNLLREKFAGSDSVVGEVEDPDCAENDEEREIQNRRLSFYTRNGYINTGIKVLLFDVDYLVLEMDLGKNHTGDDVAAIYQEHYKTMLPKKMYLKKFEIKK